MAFRSLFLTRIVKVKVEFETRSRKISRRDVPKSSIGFESVGDRSFLGITIFENSLFSLFSFCLKMAYFMTILNFTFFVQGGLTLAAACTIILCKALFRFFRNTWAYTRMTLFSKVAVAYNSKRFSKQHLEKDFL